MLPLLLGVLLIVFYGFSRKRKSSSLPLPPGPKKLPILGNILQMPSSENEWEVYADWAREFNSDILHVQAGNNSLILVNTVEIAKDLLDKRSAKYSSRPQFTMSADLVGWIWSFVSMPYSDAWKERRRMFQKNFHPSDDSIHKPREIEFIRQLLPRILDTPEDILPLTKHMMGGITLSLGYGIDIHPTNDPWVDLAGRAMEGASGYPMPGTFLVDTIPILKYVPEWFPGAGFQTKARIWRGLQERFRQEPFDATVRDLNAGTARPSFVSVALSRIDDGPDAARQRDVIRDTAGMFFAAGAETTGSSIHTFILAMLCHPEIQAKAQKEIDETIGTGRLPEFSDQANLPYLAALVKEVMRWRPVTPMAVPHKVIEEDIYNGYYIPAGSTIIPNVWAMLRNQDHYPDPLVFNPDRFLKDGQLNPAILDPTEVVFGFGRRACPGSHIALSTLWLTAASILSTFNITKKLDANGDPIEPHMKYFNAMICYPLPFECEVKPRSKTAEKVIQSAVDY
ncbi:cytochrome P450 [Crucibulum laeve]|uniref:Cytochrome P450 n=1 Tax=Crucibulum laeve TaxID=68775 RepID=A0A5C3LMD8_9AGAR|nr:cytochrome P450 [Crucibulum laeve]